MESGPRKVLRPPVAAPGKPEPWTQNTSLGVTQVAGLVSGFWNPLAQVAVLTILARLVIGAAALPMSGRSGADWPSPLRSVPLRTVNGAPVANWNTPPRVQPPKIWPSGPVSGPRRFQT